MFRDTLLFCERGAIKMGESSRENNQPHLNGGYSIRVAKSVDEVSSLRGFWEEMCCHPNADIDFYLKVVDSRNEIVRPHVIVLYRGDRPEAMLVGRLEEILLSVKLGYKRLWEMKARALTFVYGGWLGNKSTERSQALIREVLKSLRQREADVAVFHLLRTDSPLYEDVLRSPSFLSRDHFPTVQRHWSWKLPATVEETYRVFANQHRDLRRKTRRLEERYSCKVRVRCFRDAGETEEMVQDVEEVAKKTYQRALGVGIVDTPETREALLLAAAKGWLRTYVLYVADRPCAFWKGSVYQGKFYSECMGYDPAEGRYSPGTILQMKVLKALCSEGISEVDFGLGGASYKERLGNEGWEEAWVHIFAPTLGGLRVNLLRMPVLLVDQWLRKVLTRTQLLQKIKRMWRDRLRRKASEAEKRDLAEAA